MELANGINFELRSSIQELDNKFENYIKVGSLVSVAGITVNLGGGPV